MSQWLLDLSAIWQQVQLLVSPCGTMTTGEEELLRRFFMLMSAGDIIVTNITLCILLIIEQLRAINRVRIGEENEVLNLVEYLTNTTVRE